MELNYTDQQAINALGADTIAPYPGHTALYYEATEYRGDVMTIYKVLSSTVLARGAGYMRPKQDLPATVNMDSPAIDVMTDLSKIAAATISPCATLDEARQRMIATGVRLLFTLNQHNHILGILTSKDLEGERVMKHLNEKGGTHAEIIVTDIMTPQHKVEVLNMEDISKSRVGDLVETLKNIGRQHALVMEETSAGEQVVRGIVSTTQIAKQLGTEINTADKAGSFAQLATSG